MRISIVGGGNMGCAIGYGAARYADVTVISRREARTFEILRENTSVTAVTGDYSSLRDADIILVSVKPWDLSHVLGQIRSEVGELPLRPDQVLVSVVAGVPQAELESLCGGKMTVFNAMPNIAARVGESMTYVTENPSADSALLDKVLELFGYVGKVEVLAESRLPAAMALCSCGTAFAFRYIRASMEGGIELGLKPGEALEGVLQTIKGAVALLEESGAHPEAEIDKVTTAGGLTIRGLNEMERSGFTPAVINGLKATVR